MQRDKEKAQMTRPTVGTAVEIAPGVRTVLAPNAGAMTHWGTNSYIVGDRDLAIIDPGPSDERHIQALMKAVDTSEVTHILVTHAHADHSKGARELSRRTGAPIAAYGLADAGRRDVMRTLAKDGNLGGGEGLDHDFVPDIYLREGDVLSASDWALDVVHLPGHFAGQLGFQLGDALFSGDHVMDWSSTIVSPPDGHLGDFLATCQKLISRPPNQCFAGHGAPIYAPVQRLEWLIAHRKSREMQILDFLSGAPKSIGQIVTQVYLDIPEALRPAASRNVLAHLIDLWERSLIEAIPTMQQDAVLRLR